MFAAAILAERTPSQKKKAKKRKSEETAEV